MENQCLDEEKHAHFPTKSSQQKTNQHHPWKKLPLTKNTLEKKKKKKNVGEEETEKGVGKEMERKGMRESDDMCKTEERNKKKNERENSHFQLYLADISAALRFANSGGSPWQQCSRNHCKSSSSGSIKHKFLM